MLSAPVLFLGMVLQVCLLARRPAQRREYAVCGRAPGLADVVQTAPRITPDGVATDGGLFAVGSLSAVSGRGLMTTACK